MNKFSVFKQLSFESLLYSGQFNDNEYKKIEDMLQGLYISVYLLSNFKRSICHVIPISVSHSNDTIFT